MMAEEILIPMRFQDRDARILQAIQEYGGVMARRQIQQLFWQGKSQRAMQNRLAKLKSHCYIDWSTLEQRKLNPIPEPIVWLGWRGALLLANNENCKVNPPNMENENQIRLFERSLRDKGFHWLREPRWTQLNHDLTCIDIRLKIESDIKDIKHLWIGQWINETDFRSNYDCIVFTYKDKNGQFRNHRRGIIPDGYFHIINRERESRGLPAKAHFLLEVDMATHANNSFGIEKAAAGAAYILSKEYRSRFGSNAGRWIIVTTSDIRMRHLMDQTQEKTNEKSSLFLFTTLPAFFSGNVFLEAIWSVCGQTKTQTLLPEKE